MKPSRLLALFCTLAVGSTLLAQAPAAETTAAPAPVSWTVSAAGVSQYMFRGMRLSGPAIQPAVEMGSGNLALGVWSSFPLDDTTPGQSDPEIDGYGSYKFVLSEALSIQPGFTWYNYPRAEKANGFYKSTFEPSIALNYSVAGFTFTPKYYYDVVLEGPTYELNVLYALPLKQIGSELDFIGTVGTYIWKDAWENTDPKMKNWGDYWLVGVSMPFQVSSNSKLTLGVSYTKGSNNYLKQGTAPRFWNSMAAARGFATVSYVMSF